MKTKLMPPGALLLGLLFVLSSCEHLFDKAFNKEPQYTYIVENNTATTVELVTEINRNSVAIVIGDGKSYYTLAPDGSAEVWVSSGNDDEHVWDIEKNNQELQAFKVTAKSNGRPAIYNLSSASRWKYERLGNYKAKYTLTLTDAYF
ncbi:hypothetical protein [Pontibacter oryzae]|uniref:Uncharacterized protein n=1 Tax=Pontibacter oryzae TaxID=2304593 RepID=A0A399SIZ4_9BACT|nr:hypothetical protein [Pontibacter oryzae]RIJ42964.1 hypothetical protein D1627_03765 [Pontibacter oryzae]